MSRAVLLLLFLAPVAPARPHGQSPVPLPAGVTEAMLVTGKELFEGAGLCAACHGFDAKGSVGPDLTDSAWLHHKGEYEEIFAQVVRGISAEESKTGAIMPPRGGSSLTDAELRAVAAYVWSLSRRPSRGSGGR